MICIFTKLVIEVAYCWSLYTCIMCDKGAVFTIHLFIVSVMGEDLAYHSI